MALKLNEYINLIWEQLERKENRMPLVGIIAKKKDIEAIKKEIKEKNVEIIEITKDSIKNLKNIKFEEIIFIENIKFEEDEYTYMKELISKSKYLIINEDMEMNILNEIEIQKPIKLITFGFNSKSTITVSSVTEEKIIVCLQREIAKHNKEILECQEMQMQNINAKKIYNNLVVFIIKVLHNL